MARGPSRPSTTCQRVMGRETVTEHKFRCDRCGTLAVIPEGGCASILAGWLTVGRAPTPQPDFAKDLCSQCSSEFWVWVREPPEPSEAPT